MKKRTGTRASVRARTSTACASPPKAHNTASKKSNMDDLGSDFEEEVNNNPSFLIAENARLNDLLSHPEISNFRM
jgi:hypothetical protein